MNHQTLKSFRELEGLVDIRPEAQTISVPRKDNNICAFAESTSFMATKLYECKYSKKCDNQFDFGYRKYCRTELNK